MSDSFYDKTSAADTIVGFEYQYYYFLYELLNLEEGQIGFEFKDDVHIELSDGRLVLIQLKHTTQVNTVIKGKEELINLTTRDEDLWHTIHNWIEIIKNVGGKTETDRKKFILNTTFLLVTNKLYSKRNEFLKELEILKSSKDISIFKTFLTNLHTNTKDPEDTAKKNPIKENIKELLETEFWADFVNQIEIKTDFDDLFQKIEKKIKYRKSIDDKQVERAFGLLDSNIRKYNYQKFKNKEKIIISADEFHKLSQRCFNIVKSGKLPVRKGHYYKQPLNPEDQIFIKQLIDIGAIDIKDTKKIIDFTNMKLSIMNSFKAWELACDLLKTEIEEFEKNSIEKWAIHFENSVMDCREILESPSIISKDTELQKIARSCLKKVRELELAIHKTTLSPLQSNGHFYYLSDENPRIGWIHDWDKKYKS